MITRLMKRTTSKNIYASLIDVENAFDRVTRKVIRESIININEELSQSELLTWEFIDG